MSASLSPPPSTPGKRKAEDTDKAQAARKRRMEWSPALGFVDPEIATRHEEEMAAWWAAEQEAKKQDRRRPDKQRQRVIRRRRLALSEDSILELWTPTRRPRKGPSERTRAWVEAQRLLQGPADDTADDTDGLDQMPGAWPRTTARPVDRPRVSLCPPQTAPLPSTPGNVFIEVTPATYWAAVRAGLLPMPDGMQLSQGA